MSVPASEAKEEKFILTGGKFRKKYIIVDIFSFISIVVASRFIIFNVEQSVIEAMPLLFWGGLFFFSFCMYMAFPRIILSKYAVLVQATDIVGRHFTGNVEETTHYVIKLREEGTNYIHSSKETGKPVRLTYNVNDDGLQVITVENH